ncbi:ABC transporter substrate-binding protein, partial [Paracoccaceae bacterium]|nr:ABC transporter substrate-binding protein [Paracoccaceae bacterium]
MRKIISSTMAVLALSLATAPLATAADLKVGLVLTLSGPPGALGKQAQDGFNLAVETLGGSLGGAKTTVVVADDELKPDVALTRVKSLLERDDVDIVVGTIFSNMLAAIYKPVIKADKILISPNAGPSTFAGKKCHPNFFVTSYQNNQNFEALGKYAQDNGIKRVFMLAPNYQAGRDSMNGFKKHFQGEIADEVFTPLGHKDFSAQIAQIATSKADAVFTFMPGGMGVRFVKQFDAAGLSDKMTFLSAFTVDETTLPAQKDAAVGLFGAGTWAPDFDLDRSKAFVASFEAKYGYVPGSYAMQAYDAALLIDSAVSAVGGDVSDKAGLKAALKAAKFDSMRGTFKFNNNQYPIQDFYLL